MPRRIVILTQKEIGDLVVVTALIRALHKNFPGHELIVASRPVVREVYANNTAISGFVNIQLADVKKGPVGKRVAAFFRYLWILRRLKAEIVLQLEANDVMALWTRFSGAKIRIGVRNQTFRRLFSAINTLAEGEQSALLFYLSFLDPLAAAPAGFKTELFAHSRRGLRKADGILIHPGARIQEKLWPVAKWLEFLGRLRKKYPRLRIRVAASIFDKDICDSIREGADPKWKLEWAEIKTFQDLCNAVAESELVMVMDSSPRHVAAAYDVPTIAIVPEWTLNDWGIYDKNRHRVVVSHTVRPVFGLDTIEVAAVSDAFEKYWRELKKSPPKRIRGLRKEQTK